MREMRRLLKAAGREELLQADRQSQATEMARLLNCWVVLKGGRTVVAAPNGDFSINSSGTPALATGGTGDILTGIIAALLCQYEDPTSAIQLAVFLHGLAAELSPGSKRSMIADDLPELLGAAMEEVSPLA